MITELQLEYTNMALLWPINKIGKKIANSIANGLDRALNKVSDPKEYLEKIEYVEEVYQDMLKDKARKESVKRLTATKQKTIQEKENGRNQN